DRESRGRNVAKANERLARDQFLAGLREVLLGREFLDFAGRFAWPELDRLGFPGVVGLRKAFGQKILVARLERADVVAVLLENLGRLDAANAGRTVQVGDLVLGQHVGQILRQRILFEKA